MTHLLLCILSAFILLPCSYAAIQEVIELHDMFVSQMASKLAYYSSEDIERAMEFINVWNRGPSVTNTETVETYSWTNIVINKNSSFKPRVMDASQGNYAADTNNCGPGREVYSLQTSDVCKGRSCFVRQVLCGIGGTPQYLQGDTSIYLVAWTNCSVTQLACSDGEYGSYNINLQEQFGATGCYASSFSCLSGQNVDSCIVQVNCDNFTSYGNSSFGLQCQTDKLVCNQQEIPPSQFGQVAGNISNGDCVIQSENCGTDSSPCTRLHLRCEGQPQKCSLTQSDCEIICSRPMNSSSCVCPDDYFGPTCGSQREFSCVLDMIAPIITHCLSGPTSDPKDSLLDGDRKCNVYTMDQQANTGFFLDCSFTTKPSTPAVGFSYWLTSEKFNLSTRESWMLQQKVFNFARLSDFGMRSVVALLPEQMLGSAPVWFNLTLRDIPDQFWFGRRLYSEISFVQGSAPIPYANIKALNRTFIDVLDGPIKNKGSAALKSWQIALITIGVVVFVAGMIVGILFYYKRTKLSEASTQRGRASTPSFQ